jgi:hypothetical protein
LDQARLAAALPIPESVLLGEQPSGSAPTGFVEPIDILLLARIKKKADSEANLIAQAQDPLLGRLMPKVVEDVVAPTTSKRKEPGTTETAPGQAPRRSDSQLRPVHDRPGMGNRPRVDTLEFRPTDAAESEPGPLPF